MDYHVIDPEPRVAPGGYVTPDGIAPDGAGRPEALPRGEYSALGQPTGDDTATQPAWGWGTAPSYPAEGEDIAAALTDLPSNPVLYTARQQDAARRDIAARLGCYAEYRPEPFVSSQQSVVSCEN